MTRIIAGVVGGRRIAVPPSGTRPTSDRVREALFSALEADPGLAGASVLDLCAGSGALGLEALSRGAGHALFVESDRRAGAVLRRNIADLGMGGRAGVRVAGVAAVLGGPAPRGYDLLLADPPYAVGGVEITGWLVDALGNGWLADGATVVVERPARDGEFRWPEPLVEWRERRYGDTVLYVGGRYSGPPGSPGSGEPDAGVPDAVDPDVGAIGNPDAGGAAAAPSAGADQPGPCYGSPLW